MNMDNFLRLLLLSLHCFLLLFHFDQGLFLETALILRVEDVAVELLVVALGEQEVYVHAAELHGVQEEIIEFHPLYQIGKINESQFFRLL